MEKKMIEGKTIAITRAEDDSQEFIDLITKEKGNALPLPTIELVSKGEKIVDEFLSALAKEDPDYSVFMSSKAVIFSLKLQRRLENLKNYGWQLQIQLCLLLVPKPGMF